MVKKFPFWVIPFTLFLFLAVVFLILYFNNKLWFLKNYSVKSDTNILKENKPGFVDDFNDSLLKPDIDKSIKDLNKNIETKKSVTKDYGDLKEREFNKEVDLKFLKGLDYFNSYNYKMCIETLEEFLRLSKDFYKNQKANLYIGYAKMLEGIKNKSIDSIEEARNIFIKVYKTVSKDSDIFSKTVIGIAKSSRLLKNYPEKIDDLLKEVILIEKDERIRRIVFYEISLYYLYNSDFKRFVMYIERSGRTIKEEDIITLILEQQLVSLSLIDLMEKNILNINYFPYLKYRVQEKLFNDAKTYYYNGNKEESLYILKKILTIFPYDSIIEDANYFIASIYHKELEFNKALYYYDQVLSNQFPDYDAASLFRKGIIYYRQANYEKAKSCFMSITTDYVSSNYYKPAKDWLREIEKTVNINRINETKKVENKEDKKEIKEKEDKIEIKKSDNLEDNKDKDDIDIFSDDDLIK